MTDEAFSHGTSLPLPVLERIDRTCTEFEMAWRAGSPRPLDEFLGDVRGTERYELLRELLLLDLDYRSRTATRFPEDAELVADVFRHLSAQAACAAKRPRGPALAAAERPTPRSTGKSTAGDAQKCDDNQPAPIGGATTHGGRFRIIRRHAKGGLGEVFVAHDEELNREVAVKDIQERYAGSPACRSRFRMEAEVTGGLEHPGIVPVYSLGSCEDGRPYYAMRLIRGVSLEEAIRRYHDSEIRRTAADRAIEFRKLLASFIDVCQAIAYAHSRGVLHRDIKPANVMLGQYGEALVVDWGLAKVVSGGEGSEHVTEEPALLPRAAEGSSAATVAGAAIGTPAFMSPEQATGRLADVGPKSDIYALGAVLYTILTGKAPVAGNTAADVLGKVKAGDFERPRTVESGTPRPLEAIVLKAMALDPDHRYDSASELAGDIEAWLADEMVSAYSEPLLARIFRWIRRHQAPVAAACAAAVVAIASLSAGVAMLAAKSRDLRIASGQATAAKGHAQQRFKLAMEAIEGYYKGVSEEILLKQAELSGLRTRLLQVPLGFYERLRSELESDPSIESRQALADAYHAISRILGESGSVSEALDAIRKAIDIRESLVAGGHGGTDTSASLIAGYQWLASLQSISGDTLQALATNRRTLNMCGSLADRFPDHDGLRILAANLHNNIGLLQADLNRWDEAEASYKKAMKIRATLAARHPSVRQLQRDLAGHYSNLAVVHKARGDFRQAVDTSLTAVRIREKLYDEDPNSTSCQCDLGLGYYDLANLYRELGDGAQAIELFQKSIQLWEELIREFPNVSAWQMSLAKALNNCAELIWRRGERERALEYFERAIAIHQRLASSYPQVADHRFNLGIHFQNLGTLQENNGDHREALENYQQAIRIHEQLAAEFPEIGEYRFYLGKAQRCVGRLFRRTGEQDRAIDIFQQAVRTCAQLIEQFPDVPKYRGQMGLILNSLALAQQASGHVDDARKSYDRAIEIGKQLVQDMPAMPQYTVRLGGAYCNKAQLEQATAGAEASIPLYSEAISILNAALAHDDSYREAHQFLWNSLWGRATAFTSLGRYQEAISDWDRSIELDARNSARPKMERALVRALWGDHATATTDALQLAREEGVPSVVLYEAARVFSCAAASALQDESLSGSERRELAENYARQAITLLSDAHKRGYFQSADRIQKLKQDPRLKQVRSRGDFQRFLQDLEQQSTARPDTKSQE